MTPFKRSFHVGWGDLDSNGHMSNTAYLDIAVDVRMMYFEEQGFPVREFGRLAIGPVVRKDEVEYYREMKLLEVVEVMLELAGLSEDGSRFRLRNVFYRPDGKVAAQVTTTGGWLDLQARRLTAPPAELLAALQGLARSEDFEALPNSIL
ncbi:MAG: thioesterase family protein [Chloroflexi bacterium]|nr:thioesterase family protein [Chloroflexota bacterium]